MWYSGAGETERALQHPTHAPAELKRAATAFRPKPASTSRRVFSVRTQVELPRLPLPSTQIRTLKTLPALLGRARWSRPTSGQTRPHYKAGGANRKSENSE